MLRIIHVHSPSVNFYPHHLCITKPSQKTILCDQKSDFEGLVAFVWFLLELNRYAGLLILEFKQSFDIGQPVLSTSDMIKDPT